MYKSKITNHVLVPKYEVLSKGEKQKLLKKFNISENQLPKILASDAVVKEIGVKVGEILKITRKSDVAGKSIYYRLVVSD